MNCNDCVQQMKQLGSTGSQKQMGDVVDGKWVQTGVDSIYIYQCPECKTVAVE